MCAVDSFVFVVLGDDEICFELSWTRIDAFPHAMPYDTITLSPSHRETRTRHNPTRRMHIRPSASKRILPC